MNLCGIYVEFWISLNFIRPTCLGDMCHDLARLVYASVMFLAGSGWRVLLVEVAGAVHSEEGNSHGLMWSGVHTHTI